MRAQAMMMSAAPPGGHQRRGPVRRLDAWAWEGLA